MCISAFLVVHRLRAIEWALLSPFYDRFEGSQLRQVGALLLIKSERDKGSSAYATLSGKRMAIIMMIQCR